MKKLISTLGLASIALVAMSFINPVKETSFKVDAQKSIILWNAKKVTGEHSGTIKLNGGELSFNGAKLAKGSFTMNMNSITTTDLQGEWADKLVGHLKSEDFFSVEKNPTSTFVITKVTSASAGTVNITGNLSIKGITKPLTFPATLAVKGNALTATAKGVKVDRTKYDIRYGSKSFFASIGDKAIDDEFTLDITLVASK
ncbi:MAG: YceI family protein [Sphingobacteriaceae bacterium]